MIKFYTIIICLLVFYVWLWSIEKDLIEEKEHEERKKMEKEKLLREYYW